MATTTVHCFQSKAGFTAQIAASTHLSETVFSTQSSKSLKAGVSNMFK